VQLELWDYARLVREAREAGVFLVTAKEGTSFFFRVPWREEPEFGRLLWETHFRRLRSNPRPVEKAVALAPPRLELVPAVAVDYAVDETFETQVGIIHRARETGRVLFPLGQAISDAERVFWARSQTRQMSAEEGARDAVPFFGVALADYRRRVAQTVAARLSTTVSYTGANNRAYSKRCEVRPSQVRTTSQQVLFARRRVSFGIGPRRYDVAIADDAARPWVVSGAAGFPKGAGGFVAGNGVVCNDCGVISDAAGPSGGLACSGCDRSLCRDHAWTWPSRWLSRTSRGPPVLCSRCYGRKDPHPDHLAPRQPAIAAPWKAALLGLVPGLPFFLEKRWLAGAGLAALLGGLLALDHAAAADVEAVVAMGVAASASASFAWSRRIAAHLANRRTLASYAPAWADDAAPAPVTP
jgi:hypothetical protein